MEYKRNRKTVQLIVKNRKTVKKFDQSKKPQAKSGKTCTHLTSLRRIFFTEKREKHRAASNSAESENPILFCRKPKIESETVQKPPTAIITKAKNPKFFCTTTEKPI